MGAEGYTLKIYKYGLKGERVGGRGGETGVGCGDVGDTGRNRVTADMSHVYFYSASRRPRCRNHSQVAASCQKLRHSVTKILLWGRRTPQKKQQQEKKSHTLLQSATRKHTADTQHTLSQDIYCIYAAEAEHTSGTFKNSQWRQHLQAVNINSFPSHLRITSLLSLIYFFIFLAHLCGNVSSFHILHVALYF